MSMWFVIQPIGLSPNTTFGDTAGLETRSQGRHLAGLTRTKSE